MREREETPDVDVHGSVAPEINNSANFERTLFENSSYMDKHM